MTRVFYKMKRSVLYMYLQFSNYCYYVFVCVDVAWWRNRPYFDSTGKTVS